jgi:hypothetical protein
MIHKRNYINNKVECCPICALFWDLSFSVHAALFSVGLDFFDHSNLVPFMLSFE